LQADMTWLRCDSWLRHRGGRFFTVGWKLKCQSFLLFVSKLSTFVSLWTLWVWGSVAADNNVFYATI
jgi:hypothetical protein